jgi:hypothetical protein
MPVCPTTLREVCDRRFVDDRELRLSRLPDFRQIAAGGNQIDLENSETMLASTLAALEIMSA